MNYTTWKQTLAGRSLPLAWLDLDALEANAQTLLAQGGNLPIRIATKSIRSRPILRHILNLSPRFQGLMCYTAAEALWLAESGFDDLLVAYPTADAAAVRGLCTQIQAGKRLWLMVDSLAHLGFLSVLAEDAGVVLPICLDLDMSSSFPGLHFGVQRSPIRSPEAALALAEATRTYPSLRLDALMGYEAQIAGVGDAAPGDILKNKVIQTLQHRSFAQVSQRRQATVKALQTAGFELTLINGGGTGSLSRTSTEPGLTELTAGSGFYAPTLFDRYQHLQLQPAAGFALAAVRKPAPGVYTCLGGGYIASGSIGPEKLPQPWLPLGQLMGLEGAGEVQTPVQFAIDPALQLGDPILFRHAKAGELCEHFTHLHLVRDGEMGELVPTYRGEGQSFL